MKLKQIALAAMAAAALPAFAAPVQLWVTGASAPMNAVFQGAMSLCAGMKYKNAAGEVITNPGTLAVKIYMTATGDLPGASSNDRVAYTCVVDTEDDRAGTLEGQELVMYHTVEGGSFNAYSPALVLAGEPNPNSYLPASLGRIPAVSGLTSTGKCAASDTGAAIALTISGVVNGALADNVTPTGAVKRYKSCGTATVTLATGAVAPADTGPTQSIGGFSDVEYGINQALLEVVLGAADIGSVAKTNLGQAFGVAVNHNLYKQLQINQGFASSCYTPTVNTSSLACQPNLKSAEYASLVDSRNAGSIDGSFFGGTAATEVRLLRRTPTSGTQATSNVHFLKAPCASGTNAGQQAPSRATDSTAKFKVSELSSTSTLKGTSGLSASGTFLAASVMSLENTPTASETWGFVKLDGVSPNLVAGDSYQRASAVSGEYTMWNELEVFTSSQAGDDGTSLLSALKSSLANPELTNLKGLFHTGLSGATASAGANNSVSKFYKDGNSCAPIIR